MSRRRRSLAVGRGVRARRRAASRSARSGPVGSMAVGSSTSSPATASRIAAERFVFAAGPVAAGALPRRSLGDLIRGHPPGRPVSSGRPPGDDRFAAGRLPAWIDYDGACFGDPGVDGRAPRSPPTATVRAFDPTDRRTGRRSRLDRACARDFLRRRLPGPGRWADRRDPGLPVRDHADTHFIIDRHPDLGQRLDRRGRVGARLQARAADRRVRRRAAARRAGRPGRGALLADPPARRADRPAERRQSLTSGYSLTGSGPSGTSMSTRPSSTTTG